MQRIDPIIEQVIDAILEAEGGLVFSDRAADRGGPTFAGVTLKTFTAWRLARCGTTPSVDDLKAIREPELREIYRERYILAPAFDKIRDPELRLNVIDAGVLHGTGWAARRLQEVANHGGAGLKVDGILGPLSLGAVNAAPFDPALNLRFIRRRVEKVVRIARADPRQLVHLAGWADRALRFLEREAAEFETLKPETAHG